MSPRYPFRTALVTGASSGIGESMVHRLAADGVSCVVVARRADRLEALAEALPGRIEVLAADLADPAGVDAVASRLRDPDRPVELLVNNAGFGHSGATEDIPLDRLLGAIDVNVRALTALTWSAIAPMRAHGRGWILNVSSVAAFQPGPNLAVYSATKAYVISFTEALHEELRGTGVRATALCPGLTRTEFQQHSNTEGLVDRFPAVVWLTPDEVAAAGLDDVAKGRAVSVPGVPYKVLAAVSAVTPRIVKRRVSGLATGRR